MGSASDEIARLASHFAFGSPLVVNHLRGMLVEAIVSKALGPEWTWCSGDWASWDFEHAEGARLEVKQSAARQTWSQPGAKPSVAMWDIADRSGQWDGPTWKPIPGRAAQIYVLARHSVTDDGADHRDPGQWSFHVIPTRLLPATQKIRAAAAGRLGPAVDFDGLRSRVEEERAALAASQNANVA